MSVPDSPSQAKTQSHYDQHLGPIYTWMMGGLEQACENAKVELNAIGWSFSNGDVVVDLGCGSGQFALEIAKQGPSVIGIDNCETLLEELRAASSGLPLQTVCADLLDFRQHLPQMLNGIFCMGDTLTHLASLNEVSHLLDQASDALANDGVIVLTFRDYSGTPLSGTQRFLPVRSDANRILTCFLEASDTHVQVTDILNQRDGQTWNQSVSSYRKLVVPPSFVVNGLKEQGLKTHLENGNRGMIRVVATRTRNEGG